jgi:hypothetical protein
VQDVPQEVAKQNLAVLLVWIAFRESINPRNKKVVALIVTKICTQRFPSKHCVKIAQQASILRVQVTHFVNHVGLGNLASLWGRKGARFAQPVGIEIPAKKI